MGRGSNSAKLANTSLNIITKKFSKNIFMKKDKDWRKRKRGATGKLLEKYGLKTEKTNVPKVQIRQMVTSLPEISAQGIIYAYNDPDMPLKIKKTRAQTDRDNDFIIQKYLLNMSPLDIAIQLNEYLHSIGENYQVAKYSVQARIKEWRERAEESNMDLINDHFVKELAKLNRDEIELTRLWEKSKEPRMEIEYESMPADIKDGDLRSYRPKEEDMMIKKATVTDSVGDKELFEQILKIRDKRTKLLGLDRPEKIQAILMQYSPKEKDITQEYSPEMLLKMASMMQGFDEGITDSEEVR